MGNTSTAPPQVGTKSPLVTEAIVERVNKSSRTHQVDKRWLGNTGRYTQALKAEKEALFIVHGSDIT